MHVSIYLFLASLYIHDMNNAVYVNQMPDQEQCLKASFWKINHLHGSLASTNSAAPQTAQLRSVLSPFFILLD